MRFCIGLWAWTGLAVAALSAADSTPPSSASITSVVRTDTRTGKLVRTVAVRNPAVLAGAIDRIAGEQGVSPLLVRSVIQAESNYNPYAVSPKGARGLMQLIPTTARRFGVADSFNPLDNIQGGAKYLKYLLDLYHGDYPLTLAAYNAGEQSVSRYGGVPPFAETQDYVGRIGKQLAPAKAAASKPKTVEASSAQALPDGGNHVREIVQPDGSVRYVSLRELQ